MKRNNVIKLRTNTKLINFVDLAKTDRAVEPKATLVNEAQRVYKELKEEYGINYPVTQKELCKRIDWEKAGGKTKQEDKKGTGSSTFNSNFPAGMIGFISHSEQVLVGRFTEAVFDGDPLDFSTALQRGFMSFFMPRVGSHYNTTRQNGINMNQRTEFAVLFFPPTYWEKIIIPLRPAIDTFMKANGYNFYTLTESRRKLAVEMFASSFLEVVRLLVEEDLSRYDQPDGITAVKRYVTLYKEELLSIACKMLAPRDQRSLVLEQIMLEISRKRAEDTFREENEASSKL